jgi:hypothetical protein
VQTAGFRASVPAGWQAAVTPKGVVARSGGALVSVTRYPLERSYNPSKFAEAVPELDRVAAGLAADAHASLTQRATATVGGERARVYRYPGTKLGFVLLGGDEYELLCRSPGGGDPDGACALLFSSFSLG